MKLKKLKQLTKLISEVEEFSVSHNVQDIDVYLSRDQELEALPFLVLGADKGRLFLDPLKVYGEIWISWKNSVPGLTKYFVHEDMDRVYELNFFERFKCLKEVDSEEIISGNFLDIEKLAFDIDSQFENGFQVVLTNMIKDKEKRRKRA